MTVAVIVVLISAAGLDLIMLVPGTMLVTVGVTVLVTRGVIMGMTLGVPAESQVSSLHRAPQQTDPDADEQQPARDAQPGIKAFGRKGGRQ